MAPLPNPALAALLAQMGGSFTFGEVSILATRPGFELRHADDLGRATEPLDAASPAALRELARTTATGAFRPNKTAPNLRRGWHLAVRDRDELGRALDVLYPGAAADWFAGRQARPPITPFREFTARQTGLYAAAQRLNDVQAESVIRVGCHRRFCGRQRLWTVGALPTDRPEEKSVIPCLEPCALLLEFARRIARLDAEDPLPGDLPAAAKASAEAALTLALAQPDPTVREGDLAHPANPRRLRWLQDRLAAHAGVPNSDFQD